MKSHFFGEWVEYKNNEEKIEAEQYLQSWKKFFLRKVTDMNYSSEQIIDRTYDKKSTLGIKIEMKGTLPENVLLLPHLGAYETRSS